jgi:hypothetical protein
MVLAHSARKVPVKHTSCNRENGCRIFSRNGGPAETKTRDLQTGKSLNFTGILRIAAAITLRQAFSLCSASLR